MRLDKKQEDKKLALAAALLPTTTEDQIETARWKSSNKEIATRLFISEGTVKNYITTILSKEGLSHRTALAVYYLTGKK